MLYKFFNIKLYEVVVIYLLKVKLLLWESIFKKFLIFDDSEIVCIMKFY